MKEVMLSLIIWVTQNSSFTYENQALPTIEFTSNQSLASIMFSGNIPAGYDKYGLMALYNNKSGTIYISNAMDLETDYGKSVLLHELVHYLQFTYAKDKGVMCLRALERKAYELQNAYLVSRGHQAPFKKEHIFFKSFCEL